jgi:hypothetical protein
MSIDVITHVWPGAGDSLSFRPDDLLMALDGKHAIIAAAQFAQNMGARANPSLASLQMTMGDALTPMSREAMRQVLSETLPDAAQLQDSAVSDPLTRGDLARWLGEIVRRAIESDRGMG